MSSFVVGKIEYVKAAGVVAGIADQNRGSHEFYIYDYDTGRNARKDDYYRLFVECYNMNAYSVMEQYDDPEPEQDDNDYMTDFEKCYKLGKRCSRAPGGIKTALCELHHFFRSALYQTENVEYSERMERLFRRIEGQMIELMIGREAHSWGEFAADYIEEHTDKDYDLVQDIFNL